MRLMWWSKVVTGLGLESQKASRENVPSTTIQSETGASSEQRKAPLERAVCCTDVAQTPLLPKDLLAVVQAWPKLSDHVKSAILALVFGARHPRITISTCALNGRNSFIPSSRGMEIRGRDTGTDYSIIARLLRADRLGRHEPAGASGGSWIAASCNAARESTQ